MAKAMITWLGEDESYEDGNGPRRNRWKEYVFEIGKPLEVNDPHIIAKAKGNKYFKVEDVSESSAPSSGSVGASVSSLGLGTSTSKEGSASAKK